MKRFFTLLLTAVCAAAGMQAQISSDDIFFPTDTLSFPSDTKFFFGVTSLHPSSLTPSGAMTMTVNDQYRAVFHLPGDNEKLSSAGIRMDVALNNVVSLGLNELFYKAIGINLGYALELGTDVLKANFFKNTYGFQGAQIAATINGIPTTYNLGAASVDPSINQDSAYYIVATPANVQSTDSAWHELVSHFSVGQSASGNDIYLKIPEGTYFKNGPEHLFLNTTGDLIITQNNIQSIMSYLGSDTLVGNTTMDVLLKAGTQIAIQGVSITLNEDCHISSPDFWVNLTTQQGKVPMFLCLQDAVFANLAKGDAKTAIMGFLTWFDAVVGAVDEANSITVNIDFFPPVKVQTPSEEAIAAALPQGAGEGDIAAVAEVFNNETVSGMTAAETGVTALVSGDTIAYLNIELNAAKTAAKGDTTFVDSLAFEVKPMAVVYVNGVKTTTVIPNTSITSAITFRLPIDKNVDSAYVNVYHQADANSEKTSLGQYTIQVDADGNKYIEISTSSFSIFSYAVPQPKQTPLEPTSLDSLTSTSVERGIYSLDGKKLNAIPAVGLYIKDGRVQFAK